MASVAGGLKIQKVVVFTRDTTSLPPELEHRVLTLRAPADVKEDLALNKSMILSALGTPAGTADWGVDESQVVLPGASIPNLGSKRKKGE